MKPSIVLLGVFVIAAVVGKLLYGNFKLAWSGRIALSTMLLFTAVAHFIFTEGMTMMIPGFIVHKTELVYLTGIIEIMAAVGLFIPKLRTLTAWLLIAFFTLILPANINAALNQVDYQKGTFTGSGPEYLWFRIPLQILFIIWTYLSSIRFQQANSNV